MEQVSFGVTPSFRAAFRLAERTTAAGRRSRTLQLTADFQRGYPASGDMGVSLHKNKNALVV